MDQTAPVEAKTALPQNLHQEMIGSLEWTLEATKLDVHADVALWSENPRLQATLAVDGVSSEVELESALRLSKGYDKLRASIDEVGQMTPIYVQRTETGKFLVLEGSTRVCVLRELDRKYKNGLKEGTFRRVKVKILPQHFGDRDRATLIAGIHVRGSGVRAWDRYIQAKFVFETVVGTPSKPAVMNQSHLAQSMGKSESWVTRLKKAYEFAMQFVEHVDDEKEGKVLASKRFSILEEISKAKTIGPQLRDKYNSQFDGLRDDVFDMVEKKVFKEYRDARFLKEFHDDPDLWDQLKSGEEHIANRLAMEVKSNTSSPKTKISSLPQLVRRSIERGETDFDDEDIEALQRTINHIGDQMHEGVRPFRIALKNITRMLSEASMADVKDLSIDELSNFREALNYFNELIEKHGKTA